ncbi:MAG: hypothetical protein AB2A00_40435 [Myxococcota bacterium]
MAAPKTSESPRPFLGVSTTTPLAFQSAGLLHMERMSILSAEGAGILSEHVPPTGEVIPVVFTLSTSRESIRCQARVEGDVPTTPAGLSLRREVGEKAFHAAVGATLGDSATMMFRLSDYEKKPEPKPAPSSPARAGAPQQARGFCIRFLDLTPEARAAVEKHLRISRQLGEQLARRGDRMVSLSEDDRALLSEDRGGDDLSKRAMDW